jgi:hypothetical protein
VTGTFWPAVKLGTVVSALSAGVLVLLVARFSKRHGWNQYVAIAALLTSGTFIAYSGQSMTDVLSVLLFFAGVLSLLEYVGTPRSFGLFMLVGFSCLNMLLRYEGWIFSAVMILFLLYLCVSEKSSRFLLPAAILGIVSSAVIASWLYLNLVGSGSLFGFNDWILDNNGHQTFLWLQNLPQSFAQELVALTFATGVLWISLFYACVPWKENWQKLFLLMSAVYMISFGYSLYTGLNSGWPRQMLYLLPLGAVSLASPKFSTRISYLILAICIIIGAVAFAQNAILASHYAGPCCP